ncbi:hypothetical protein V1477_015157 [Vespula maculifrons]|uniref:Uncharacterized protein n=1 Tax=Vespula maculifrons TaxID=7453 RepID=A0ABD2BJI1_VESMC
MTSRLKSEQNIKPHEDPTKSGRQDCGLLQLPPPPPPPPPSPPPPPPPLPSLPPSPPPSPRSRVRFG